MQSITTIKLISYLDYFETGNLFEHNGSSSDLQIPPPIMTFCWPDWPVVGDSFALKLMENDWKKANIHAVLR